MAHLAKYTRGAVGNMLAHYDRTKEEIKNIDRSLSFLNYNCAKYQTLPQYEFIKQRLSEVHCSKRKDVNIFADWVITAPKEVQENLNAFSRVFFHATYDFLEEKYGRENVISAYVHMDEQTPHMHFAFIPVVWDKKNNREKVSAKELLTVNHLKSFHQELKNYVEKALGMEISILNKATVDGNKSIEELKRKSATERIREIDDMATKRTNEINSMATARMNEIDAIKENEMAKMKDLNQKLVENIKAVEETLEGEKRVVEKACEIQKQYVLDSLNGCDTKTYPSWVKVSEKGFGKNKQRFVTVPEEEWMRRSIYFGDTEALQKAHKTVQESIKNWQTSASARHFLSLMNRNVEFQKEIERLKAQIQKLKQENSILRTFKEKWEFLKDKIKTLICSQYEDENKIYELEQEYGVLDDVQPTFNKSYDKQL